MMGGPRKKAPKTIAVIDPDSCFGAFACSICQAACPVSGCIVEEPDRDGRMVCAVRADLCIGCGLCVTLGNPTPRGSVSSVPRGLRRHQHGPVRLLVVRKPRWRPQHPAATRTAGPIVVAQLMKACITAHCACA